MKHFLSGFSDDDAKLILKHCNEVLPKSANILLLQVQCLPALPFNNAVLPVSDPPSCSLLRQVLLLPNLHAFSDRHSAFHLWCLWKASNVFLGGTCFWHVIKCALPVTGVKIQTLVMRADYRARGRRQGPQYLQGWRGAG